MSKNSQFITYNTFIEWLYYLKKRYKYKKKVKQDEE